MTQKRLYKERRLYFSVCSKCGKENAQTFHRKKLGLCRNCRHNQVLENQIGIF